MIREDHVLFVDAYDSFSENIVALLKGILHIKVTVRRIDELAPYLHNSTLLDGFLHPYAAVVIGPGPGDPCVPADVGCIPQVWQAAERLLLPVLGICLGFQSLCLTYGATISRLPLPCHGHAQDILHRDDDIFKSVGNVLATNYHSLEVKLFDGFKYSGSSGASSPRCSASRYSSTSEDSDGSIGSDSEHGDATISQLQPLAWNKEGTLMAARHVHLPLWGLQFHPESCKSNLACHNILQNWWRAVSEWSVGRQKSFIPSPPTICTKVVDPLSLPDGNVHSDASKNIYLELARLTEGSTSVVQSNVVAWTYQDISNLCYSLSQGEATAMLESSRDGRFSIYGIPSDDSFILEYFGGAGGHVQFMLRHSPADELLSQIDGVDTNEIFEALEAAILHRRAKDGHPDSPFWGGFLGCVSYEAGLDTISVSRSSAQNSTKSPDISLLWTQRSVVVDKKERKIHVQSIHQNDLDWIQEISAQIQNMPSSKTDSTNLDDDLQHILSSATITLPDPATYKSAIRICFSRLHAGSSYELCLTTAASIHLPSPSPDTPYDLYLHLQSHNPAPYSAFLSLPSVTLLSSSPESFLTWTRTTPSLNMTPMKGTVPKSLSRPAATALLHSPKEAAENIMIADLIRHDLYSTVGTFPPARVEVLRLCDVVETQTVYQSVSHIRAHMPIPASIPPDVEECGRVITHYGHKALRRCLPPGSMTGAPKKRSCEILSQIEQNGGRRGLYSGVVGYLDVGGGGGWSVGIRGAVSYGCEDEVRETGRGEGEEWGKWKTWHVGAGGAVTVLSSVEGEWDEMRVKLESVLRAFRPRKVAK